MDCQSVCVRRGERLLEFCAELIPVQELVLARVVWTLLPLENMGSPFLSSSCLHVGHSSPYNLGLFIQKLLWTKLDVGLAQIEEGQPFGAISIKLQRGCRLDCADSQLGCRRWGIKDFWLQVSNCLLTGMSWSNGGY